MMEPVIDAVSDEALWTIRKVLKWSTTFLRERGSPSAQLDAELLLAQALHCKRIELYIALDKPLSLSERSSYREYLKRRALGEPVAYILGYKSFWRHEFKVCKDVLIPRPETELLVERALEEAKLLGDVSGLKVLDIGTGSGCVAISLALELPVAQVSAWDVSHKALATAESNAAVLGAETITFSAKNALDPMVWGSAEEYDLIVSNPPYIGEQDVGLMDQSVINFEPHLALFSEASGYAFYEVYAEYAARALKPNGQLLMEIGAGQLDRVSNLLSQYHWRDVYVCSDLAGVPRVIVARRPVAHGVL